MPKDKKTVYSGIQPSGSITLGNYVGAVKNWVEMQKEYNCVYGIVDMHAITVRQEPKALRERALQTLAFLVAVGLDPNETTPLSG